MKSRVSIWCFAVALILFLGSTAKQIGASSDGEEEHVLTLDHSNFSDVVSKKNFIVVEFYAPWCGHCKKLAPEYEKAASVLKSHDPSILLAKVNANDEANKELASGFEIKGYPTIKIIRNEGKNVQDYKGPRDADGIVSYLKKQSGPASVEINSTEVAGNLISENKIVIVGVFPEFVGEEFQNFTILAEKLRSDYELGHTADAKFLPRGETSLKGPLVRLFKPFDELFVDFQDFHVDVLEKFIEESSVPIVTTFNNDASNHPFVIKFFNSPNSKAMLFLNFSDDMHADFRSKYQEVAEQYKGKGISFLIGDLDASQGAFQYFGVKKDQVPLIIIQTNDGTKYLKSNLEPDHIAPWFKEYKDGNLSPFQKSEPIPEANNEPVKVVVADNLQEMVFRSGKNVLLEFYAPWCGHCQKLAPILDEVAVSFEKEADVVIAKLDATANDIPSDIFEIKGYPTLYLRSASGNVVQFEGDRTKEDIVDFIQKNRDSASPPQQDAAKDEL